MDTNPSGGDGRGEGIFFRVFGPRIWVFFKSIFDS